MPDLMRQDNVILIGVSISNLWDELFKSRLNFTVNLTGDGLATITNRAPAAGEKEIYTRIDTNGYCVVAYLPRAYRHMQNSYIGCI
jgi:hypothetical protein